MPQESAKQRAYRKALHFVALNDEPTWGEPERSDMRSQITILLISASFTVAVNEVIDEIIWLRREAGYYS